MTYIELINRFWELDERWQFSCCETRLYFYLLKIANRLGWEDNWTRSDTKVSSDVGVSVKVFKSARNRLVQAGLIECKQGNGRGNKSTYSIKGVQKGMQNIPPLGHPLGTPFQESSPIPPKEEYKTETKTKKEPPKGGKKESSSGELFPPSKPEKPKRVAKEFIAPTLDEVIQHFIKQNAPERLDDWQEQAEIFFNHFDSIGWKNANGVKIERWDSKANLWILDRIRENRKNELDHDGRGKEFIKQTSKFDGEGSRQAQADTPTDRESDTKAQRKYSERF